ncbi:MAG: hypothetical protein OEM16_18700 [Myxococcales bacterium]|nr:hypothetical protein [Myxococcales bacterium]
MSYRRGKLSPWVWALVLRMTASFQLTIDELLAVDDLPGAWTDDKYKEILERLDIPDAHNVPHEELPEMCAMALQDLEPLEASELTLDVCLRGILKDGQIRNAAHDLRDEALWENYPDLQAHEPLFRGAWLVSKAFPQDFPTPTIARLDLRIAPLNEAARKRISQPLGEATLLRLLAQVMDSSSILLRMFGDQIRGGAFSEAEYLLWTVEHSRDGDGVALRIHASRYMLRGLPDEGSFEVELPTAG